MKARINLPMKGHLLQLFILMAFLAGMHECQSPTIQSLSISESFNNKQLANTYQYYELTFNVANNLLEITID
jgi:hypothetical protein